MIIFYSGSAGFHSKGRDANPETVLDKKANIMLSYFLITTDGQKQHLRFPKIVKEKRK